MADHAAHADSGGSYVNMSMQEFIQKNAVTLIISILTLVSTFTATSARYEYRIGALEDEMKEAKDAIAQLNSATVATQVQLAKISSDLEYIKVQINRIVP